MALPSPSPPVPAVPVAADGLPALRVEMRHGSAPPVVHEVTSVSFLVGTVPGCDLRLPGAALPAVCCLLTRRPDGVELRKLAPIGALLVNGQPAATRRLDDGDRITLGAVGLLVRIAAAARPPAVRLAPLPIPADEEPRRRPDVSRQQAGLDAVRRELDDVRRQLYDRYRQRRDRLAALHEAIRRAARKVQERKAQADAEGRAVAARREEMSVRQAEQDARAAELADERARLDGE
ncbi:MAG TPA: FHA domain-containing protein, partial [Gemmataceae bacterium]|nr:FHA domain-containing protein [Gemmataceae bacterium]